jgi:probable HAF family extracellular repeat protein
MERLGTLPGATSSKAYGINNLGQIVGTSGGPAGSRAVIWSSLSVITDLNALITSTIPDAVLVEAHCINDAGLIGAISGGGSHAPGADHDSEHLYRAFLLTPIQ